MYDEFLSFVGFLTLGFLMLVGAATSIYVVITGANALLAT